MADIRLELDDEVYAAGETGRLKTVFYVRNGDQVERLELSGGELTLAGEVTAGSRTDELIRFTESWRVEYETSDEYIAGVDDDGTLSAAGPGHATVRVAAWDADSESPITAEADFTVVRRVESISLPKKLELTEGDALQLETLVLPADASDKRVSFSVKNSSVATVDAGGKVQARKAGKATLTVTSLDENAVTMVSASIPIVVIKKPVEPVPAPKTPVPVKAPAPSPTPDPPSTPTPNPPSNPAPAPDPAPPANPAPAADDYGQALLVYVNEARVAAGLSKLTYSKELGDAGKIRAGEIVISFSHTRPDGSQWHTVSPLAYGENIAAGPSGTKEAFELWMNSPGHKANILSSGFGSMGAARIYVPGSTYGYYWVQLFGL